MGGQGDRDEPGILRNHKSLGPGTGEKPQPTKEKVAFLRNLTRYMIGNRSEFGFRAAGQHYHRGHLQHLQTEVFSPSNPIPTFTDLAQTLSTWNDKVERSRDEAHLAAIKLRAWIGDAGVYARLLDRHTTARLDNNWLYFNIEGLSDDPGMKPP